MAQAAAVNPGPGWHNWWLPEPEGGYIQNEDSLDVKLLQCFKMFVTEPMTSWCCNLQTLGDRLQLTPAQVQQLMDYISMSFRGLEERINVSIELEKWPVNNHAVPNPADRHFSHEAQVLLRQFYQEDPNRMAIDIRKLLLEERRLTNSSPHLDAVDEPIAMRRLLQQVYIWWNLQNKITGNPLDWHRKLLRDEEHLLWALYYYRISSRANYEFNYEVLAENMWTYRPDQIEHHMEQIRFTNDNLFVKYDFVEGQLANLVMDEIVTVQERFDSTIERISESQQSWNANVARGESTARKEDDMKEGLLKALGDIRYVNHVMYNEATSQQTQIIQLLDDVSDQKWNWGTFLHPPFSLPTRHDALCGQCNAMTDTMITSHQKHKDQLENLAQRCQWFQTNIKPDIQFRLPEIPDWADHHWGNALLLKPDRHPIFDDPNSYKVRRTAGPMDW